MFYVVVFFTFLSVIARFTLLTLHTGRVGTPLPEVTCKLVDDDEATVKEPNSPGELRIKGPNVFKEYLNRPDATSESFDSDGWFRTGDIAEVSSDGYYKILGRNSSDIIKV